MKIKLMASPLLQILVTAASLLAPMVVMAQKDVVITVSYGGADTYLYNIGFNITFFTKFHNCLGKGVDNCQAHYDTGNCKDCVVDGVSQSGSSSQELNNYYECKNNANTASLNCYKQTIISPPSGVPPTTYLLRNSSYPSTCFGFVWTFSNEIISFNSDQLDIEFCDSNCTCPSRHTTPQPETSTKSSSLLPSGSLPSTTVTSQPSHSSPTSATTQRTSTTKIPTKLTTAASTANSSPSSTEPLSSAESSDGDSPIGIIVGAVVGVIVIIVIVIIIIVIWRRRRANAKSSGHANQGTSAMTSNEAGVREKTNDENLHSYYNTEFSGNSSESHAPKNGVIKTNSYQNSLHQPKNGVAPVKDLPVPQFAIKDNDSDFGYSTAQLVVPEDNNRNVNGNKTRDDYDYVYAENDVDVSDTTPQTTSDKTPVVSPPKVRDDYAVVDKSRKNKNPGNMATSKGLASDYDDIPEVDYGYSHVEGDASAKAHVTVPKSSLTETSDLNQDYEYSRASDGYTTVGTVNQSDLDNDEPNATNVYSRLHQEVRDIQNPYNVGPNTNDVYSKLHKEVRDIQNPYNVLPESHMASDSSNALPDTANSADDTKEQKRPKKSLPYGKEDYAVVVKTKSANKPVQSTFALEIDEN